MCPADDGVRLLGLGLPLEEEFRRDGGTGTCRSRVEELTMDFDPAALEQHFARVLENPPDERVEYLRRLAQAQPQLARRLAALLGAHEADAGDIESLALATFRLWETDSRLQPGREIAGWQLQHELGRGGMGVVFAAVREREGIQEQAAIKLLSVPMFDAGSMRRFMREAATLARLDHPGICRLRDWGRRDEGWAYLVLDRIDGLPLDRFAQTLPVRRCIDLVARVADAVAAAHRQLVVHLDIKPDNVLVTAAGDPVLLDFGIAKALDPEDDQAATTARWMTPGYAAPERLRGSPATVAADIWSLGAVLYRLCCDAAPFDLQRGSITEALRQIEQGPVPPCTRRRGLPRDLDAIVARAMHADPARRYGSAEALAADLRALLAGQPVSARADSVAYRFGKLLRRHPLAVPAAMVAITAVSMLALLLAFQIGEVRQRSEELQQVVAFQADMLRKISVTQAGELLTAAVNERIGSADNEAGLVQQLWQRVNAVDAARDLIGKLVLAPAVSTVEQRFPAQPLLQARLLQELATSYRNLGSYQDGLQLQIRAWRLLQESLGEHHLDTVEALHEKALLLRFAGRAQESIDAHRQALVQLRQLLGDDDEKTIIAMKGLSTMLLPTDAGDEALALAREALERSRRVFGPDHDRTGWARSDYGFALLSLGHLAEAEQVFRELMDFDYGVSYTTVTNNLAGALYLQRKFDEAETLWRQVHEQRRQVHGDESPFTLRAGRNLLNLLVARGDGVEAETLARELVPGFARSSGPDHLETLVTEIALAGALLQQRRYRETVDLLAGREALARALFIGRSRPFLARYLRKRSQAQWHLGQQASAREGLQEAVAILRQAPGPRAWDREEAEAALAQLGDDAAVVRQATPAQEGVGDGRS